MKTLLKIELKDIIQLLPDTTSLIYVDYNDNLDEHANLLQKCIKSNDYSHLWESIDDWYMDSQFQGLDYVLTELKSDIESKFDIDDAEEIMEQYEDEIRDTIYDLCDDDTTKDLLRNTNDFVAFYDLDHYVERDSWNWSKKELKAEVKAIKKTLKIKLKDTQYDDDIEMMVRQASYGGDLVVYFNLDIEYLMDNDESLNAIEFSDFSLAIIDTNNGSGDSCEIIGHTFKVGLNRDNLFLDKTIDYNYTYAVCGMSSDWCSNTEFKLVKSKVKKVGTSHLNAFQDNEVKLDKIYAKGGCTFGDMKHSRHRVTQYSNNYPCGSKCASCGTFWID